PGELRRKGRERRSADSRFISSWKNRMGRCKYPKGWCLPSTQARLVMCSPFIPERKRRLRRLARTLPRRLRVYSAMTKRRGGDVILQPRDWDAQ
ncbi:hypothetical protein B296_00029469, partial [Ensete ventricosum]